MEAKFVGHEEIFFLLFFYVGVRLGFFPFFIGAQRILLMIAYVSEDEPAIYF